MRHIDAQLCVVPLVERVPPLKQISLFLRSEVHVGLPQEQVRVLLPHAQLQIRLQVRFLVQSLLLPLGTVEARHCFERQVQSVFADRLQIERVNLEDCIFVVRTQLDNPGTVLKGNLIASARVFLVLWQGCND
jgi:hypothetical protein